jgi:hypothetical protein
MRKNFVGPALGIALGAALFFIGGEWIGVVFAVLSLVFLVLEWRYRDVRPMDPMLKEEMDEVMKLEKSDPAAAAKLLDRAFMESDRREELELADLRGRASSDRHAAVELRNRLREKLRIFDAARRKAEKSTLESPDVTAVLKELDRDSSEIEQQLAQAEQLLETFRDQ